LFWIFNITGLNNHKQDIISHCFIILWSFHVHKWRQKQQVQWRERLDNIKQVFGKLHMEMRDNLTLQWRQFWALMLSWSLLSSLAMYLKARDPNLFIRDSSKWTNHVYGIMWVRKKFGCTHKHEQGSIVTPVLRTWVD
jgi:hypothetical protein